MGFDGEAFVAEMRRELIDSGRTLDKATWIERVAQGEATPQEMVGWARQHYWGVTSHTRRFLSIWVGRIPYEMTDAVIENIGEEVLGIQSKSGYGHLHWLFQFTRALGAPDSVIEDRDAQRRRRPFRSSSTTWPTSGRGTSSSSAPSSASRTRSPPRTSGPSPDQGALRRRAVA